MRMSSAARKGDKGKSSTNSSLPLSKDGTSSGKVSNSKDSKNSDSTRSVDHINPKLQPTAEQLRIAQMIGDSKRDDPDLPEKVNKLVELTNCSSDAAIIALHDANNDLDQAILALLDGETEGDWEVSGRKRKPKQPAQQQGASDGMDIAIGSGRGRDRERSRRGGPPRLRGRGRGGRENKENVEEGESNEFGGSRGRGSRGRMSNGPGRDGGRGGRGGRGGFRRGQRGGASAPSGETWDQNAEYSNLTNVEPWGSEFPAPEEWDNEEYVGSLVETKVFTPSQATTQTVPVPEGTPLTNGSVSGAVGAEGALVAQAPPAPQVHYSNSAQQGIDLNALLQKTSGVTVAGATMQQGFLQYNQQATDALKAAMGVGVASSAKSSKPQRAKIPPPSKIPASAVEMPDDSLVSGLDVKFGTLDFGIEPSGIDIGFDVSLPPSSASSTLNKQPDHHQQASQPHNMVPKMDSQFGSATSNAQPPAPSSLPKPDSSLSGFNSSAASAAQQQLATSASQVKPTNSPASYPYGANYAPPGVGPQASSQPAGAYPSNSQSAGVYSNSGSATSTFHGASSQTSYVSYGHQQSQPQQPQTQQQQSQQQQQQQQGYQSFNNKMGGASAINDGSSNTVSSLRGDLPNSTTASRQPATSVAATMTNKPTGATMATNSSGLPNMPPGVPTVLGPGSFIMGQGLPYYAAPAAPGIQQHPVYSLEDVQYRYPHLAAGYYDMGYQSPTSLGTGREATLASLAYAGSDGKFSRNENNSPVPTSLSQNAAQSHGGAFITPAAAAATPLTPAYAYYYSGGVMPGGYQFGAPAALYPVSAAASGHAASNAAAQYVKGAPLGSAATGTAQSGQTTGSGAGGAGSNNAAASGYASYGSTYEDFSKSVYNSVGVGSAGNQTAKIGGASTGPSGVNATGTADLGVGPNVYPKTHNQLGKINTYDKTGGFHTGTPPPYGLTGNANAAPLGVGVSVGVGGPSPYGAQHMFIPALPHQSQHSHLMHPQLHQDSSSGPGQRSQSGGQQNKQGSKPSYGGSYWGSN